MTPTDPQAPLDVEAAVRAALRDTLDELYYIDISDWSESSLPGCDANAVAKSLARALARSLAGIGADAVREDGIGPGSWMIRQLASASRVSDVLLREASYPSHEAYDDALGVALVDAKEAARRLTEFAGLMKPRWADVLIAAVPHQENERT